jgi:hypothetical protein
VQLDHVRAARALMQPVHVLRDERGHVLRRFDACERAMRLVRMRVRDHGPAHHAACPVALPRLVRTDERLQRDGRRTLPFAVFVAIAGNTGVGADARAGQHEKPRMPAHEVVERRKCGGVDGGRQKVGHERGFTRGVFCCASCACSA